jgi:hypothetical protein
VVPLVMAVGEIPNLWFTRPVLLDLTA